MLSNDNFLISEMIHQPKLMIKLSKKRLSNSVQTLVNIKNGIDTVLDEVDEEDKDH
jgi:hypothetical protein